MRLLVLLASLPLAFGVLYRRSFVPGGRLQLRPPEDVSLEDAANGWVGQQLHISDELTDSSMQPEAPVAAASASCEALVLVPTCEALVVAPDNQPQSSQALVPAKKRMGANGKTGRSVLLRSCRKVCL